MNCPRRALLLLPILVVAATSCLAGEAAIECRGQLSRRTPHRHDFKPANNNTLDIRGHLDFPALSRISQMTPGLHVMQPNRRRRPAAPKNDQNRVTLSFSLRVWQLAAPRSSVHAVRPRKTL